MKFPVTFRLDNSDEQVYPVAAPGGEPAVPGGFAFADADLEGLTGKERLAFAGGWLGVGSFGRSTFALVSEIDEETYDAVVRDLAAHLVACYGAPDVLAALPAAREEAAYACELCAHKINTLLAIERELSDEGIVERFRVVVPPQDAPHARIWRVEES